MSLCPSTATAESFSCGLVSAWYSIPFHSIPFHSRAEVLAVSSSKDPRRWQVRPMAVKVGDRCCSASMPARPWSGDELLVMRGEDIMGVVEAGLPAKPPLIETIPGSEEWLLKKSSLVIRRASAMVAGINIPGQRGQGDLGPKEPQRGARRSFGTVTKDGVSVINRARDRIREHGRPDGQGKIRRPRTSPVTAPPLPPCSPGDRARGHGWTAGHKPDGDQARHRQGRQTIGGSRTCQEHLDQQGDRPGRLTISGQRR